MDLASKKNEVVLLGRDLDMAEQACNPLERSFTEYCPDICNQQNKVKRLKNRYTMINNQLQERWVMVAYWHTWRTLPWTHLISDDKYSFVLFIRIALVKEAANKNQDFQNALQSLDFFLMNLPNNTIKPADNTAQITAKGNSQEVCRKTIILIVFFTNSLILRNYIHTIDCVDALLGLMCYGLSISCLT